MHLSRGTNSVKATVLSHSFIWKTSRMSQRTKQNGRRWETASLHRLKLLVWQGSFNRWHYILNMCHRVGLTQTSVEVIKTRKAVILLGLFRIWCKSFPQCSSFSVDPVDVTNCFSLLAWLVFPWPSSLSTLGWQQHNRSCPTYRFLGLFYAVFVWYNCSCFWLFLWRAYMHYTLWCSHTWSHIFDRSQRADLLNFLWKHLTMNPWSSSNFQVNVKLKTPGEYCWIILFCCSYIKGRFFFSSRLWPRV